MRCIYCNEGEWSETPCMATETGDHKFHKERRGPLSEDQTPNPRNRIDSEY